LYCRLSSRTKALEVTDLASLSRFSGEGSLRSCLVAVAHLRLPLYRNSVESRKDEGGVKQASIARRTASGGNFEVCAASGRVLVMLIALIIFVMPWTEYFWSFDKFLRGGQDFELGLLSLAALLCLVVVLLQHGRQNVAFLLAIRRWLSFVNRDPDSMSLRSLYGLLAAVHASPLPSPALGMYNLPIQV
jgi:hypothetical protein